MVRNHENKTTLRASAAASIACFFVLLIGAVWFYRERVFFLDSSFGLFVVLNDHHFCLSENRFVATIPQSLPLAGVALGLPISVVCVLWSVSFVVMYIIGCLILWCMRAYEVIILALVYCTAFVTETWYWPVNELHQGIIVLLLAFAVARIDAHNLLQRVLKATLYGCLLVVGVWAHPLAILTVAFFWVFFALLRDSKLKPITTMGYAGFAIVASVVKYFASLGQGYDGNKMNAVSRLNATDVLHAFNSSQFRGFATHLVTIYWPLTLVAIAGFALLLKQKHYLLVGWSVLFALGSICLISIVYPHLDKHLWYIESEYMFIAVVLAAPVVFCALSKAKPKWAVLSILLFFGIRVIYIVDKHHVFSNRVTFCEQILKKMEEKHINKLVLINNEAINNKLLLNWGSTYESVVLSAAINQRPTRNYFIAEHTDTKVINMKETHTQLGPFGNTSIDAMNQRYFNLDTSNTYIVLQLSDLMQ
jgi:hypothetical protein